MEIRIVLEEMWFLVLQGKEHKNRKYCWLQLQTKGIDIGQSSLSALEGQRREASDGRCWLSPKSFRCPWSGCSSRMRSESLQRGRHPTGCRPFGPGKGRVFG